MNKRKHYYDEMDDETDKLKRIKNRNNNDDN